MSPWNRADWQEGESGFTAKPLIEAKSELRSEPWEGASKARGRERLHREAREYWKQRVNCGASPGKGRAKQEGESGFTAKPWNIGRAKRLSAEPWRNK